MPAIDPRSLQERLRQQRSPRRPASGLNPDDSPVMPPRAEERPPAGFVEEAPPQISPTGQQKFSQAAQAGQAAMAELRAKQQAAGSVGLGQAASALGKPPALSESELAANKKALESMPMPMPIIGNPSKSSDSDLMSMPGAPGYSGGSNYGLGSNPPGTAPTPALGTPSPAVMPSVGGMPSAGGFGAKSQMAYRKGGKVKTYAKGGEVKSSTKSNVRGGGCEQRGKTRGRFV